MILVFFEAFVAALGLDIKALELWLETDALWDLFLMGCVDLGINHQ